ncbi:MAG: hypothetical protein D8M57_03165 [Candidatus Scalindua sp. AMX11]|nr:MAG: hypothetical protein DWQ00_16825 [Candidatus Scalindua sp.]NOG85866.1 hypothetical protein [Planctomycetota bacterium]RZV96962.1 MAG: hypothetical protein EX341_01905 [Candidatus Scalindua sp. SCAELEC01]TDE66426.1 MAG: hypothetical protein D8M57_03165 [Candidatus Scalindua sp. AMX11]GJQ58183.1 MAG: hypothetical protein SCALA701_09840 [Candidatus Scalindua sp.]
MDITDISSSEISAQRRYNTNSKNNRSNRGALEKVDQHQFDIFLNKESKRIKPFSKPKQKTETFQLEGGRGRSAAKTTQNQYPETYVSSKGIGKLPKSAVLQQYQMYKEDQLLSNPGGDNYFIGKTKGVVNNNFDHSSFTQRVGKDLKDAGANLLNAAKDVGIGSKFNYINKQGEIKEGRKVGFAKTLAHFCKNVASGLTFGAYTPKGEVAPHGGIERVRHFFGKIFKDAILGNVVKGVPRSVIHVGEDVLFAGLNTLEAVPDATIGNFKVGRKATTKIFDNAQVLLDIATDVMPGGDASVRTRAMNIEKGLRGLPLIHNLSTPENQRSGEEWRYVRNTPFRKVVETLLSLIPFKF